MCPQPPTLERSIDSTNDTKHPSGVDSGAGPHLVLVHTAPQSRACSGRPLILAIHTCPHPPAESAPRQ
eukprot:351621-Chlamydomonas_euryale.AAC.6